MEDKTTKRVYLAIGIVVVIVLCVVAGMFLTSRQPADEGERVAEPSVPPSLQTKAPTAAPTASPTPTPTAYILPLVPQWGSPTPSHTPPVPEANARGPALSGGGGRYDDTCKDLLAVGIQNGMATAVLLVRVQETEISVLSIPCETVGAVYTLDADCRITAVDSLPLSLALRRGGSGTRQRLWNLVWAVKNTVGVEAVHFVALELGCLVELVETLDGLTGQDGTVTPEQAGEILASGGSARAAGMGQIGVGLVNAMKTTALWELPALQRLTRDKLWSGLSTRQMVALALTFQKTERVACEVLPTEESGGVLVISYPDAEKLLKKLYQ